MEQFYFVAVNHPLALSIILVVILCVIGLYLRYSCKKFAYHPSTSMKLNGADLDALPLTFGGMFSLGVT